MRTKNINSNEQLLQLVIMVLSEQATREQPPTPTYLYSQAPDNENSVLFTGAQLWSESLAEPLVIVDNVHGGNKGYPGAQSWQNWLTGFKKVDGRSITTFPCFELLHTYSESLAFVRYAQQMGWHRVNIVAPPFHMPRAFISMVSAVVKMRAKIRVYCQSTTLTLPVGWSQRVAHSQGTLVRRRDDLIVEELRRIKAYTRKGDLIPVKQVLRYLERRAKL